MSNLSPQLEKQYDKICDYSDQLEKGLITRFEFLTRLQICFAAYEKDFVVDLNKKERQIHEDGIKLKQKQEKLNKDMQQQFEKVLDFVVFNMDITKVENAIKHLCPTVLKGIFDHLTSVQSLVEKEIFKRN